MPLILLGESLQLVTQTIFYWLLPLRFSTFKRDFCLNCLQYYFSGILRRHVNIAFKNCNLPCQFTSEVFANVSSNMRSETMSNHMHASVVNIHPFHKLRKNRSDLGAQRTYHLPCPRIAHGGGICPICQHHVMLVLHRICIPHRYHRNLVAIGVPAMNEHFQRLLRVKVW